MNKIIILLTVAIGCFCGSLRAQDSSNIKVNIASAEMYISMAEKAMNSHVMPEAEEWDSLFASPAYKALFSSVRWNRKTFKRNVREAFEIVYDPSKAGICDSMLKMLDTIDLDIDSELPFFVSTAHSIKTNLPQYKEIISTIDMDRITGEAHELALTLVPDNIKELTPEAINMYFIVWDLECRALGECVFLDINSFLNEGIQPAIENLAHEMHHHYLQVIFNSVYETDIMDGAVVALITNMREGVADILNKKKMPVDNLYPYGEQMVATYNEDYMNSPQVLARLDSTTCNYLDGKIDMEQYIKEGMEAAHFGGHTTGDFMVFLIRDLLGIEAVVESIGDLDAFVDNYNLAAEKAGTYKFSDRFVQHIHNISLPAKRTKS
ncbi:MAG: hypothetical protein HDR92_04555 [Bacteroides sp.]|nr:hypothetical protein [Bacteroides sp.]